MRKQAEDQKKKKKKQLHPSMLKVEKNATCVFPTRTTTDVW